MANTGPVGLFEGRQSPWTGKASAVNTDESQEPCLSPRTTDGEAQLHPSLLGKLDVKRSTAGHHRLCGTDTGGLEGTSGTLNTHIAHKYSMLTMACSYEVRSAGCSEDPSEPPETSAQTFTASVLPGQRHRSCRFLIKVI